jgi:predicted dehydrogenase
MNAAIVGLGKMGLLHMSILSMIPGVKVIAVCDKSKLIAKFAKSALSELKLVNAVDELSDLDLDVIYVTTPIPSHFNVLECIYRDKIAPHVFIEKTLANSLDQAEKVCSMFSKGESITMVGYERRYSVTFNKAYDLISQGTIGKLVSFKAYAYSADFLSLNEEKASKVSASRGGLLRDLCSHAIDLSLWFFGNFQVVEKNEVRRNNSEFIESLSFRVATKDGVDGIIDASWSKKGYRLPELGLEVIGTKGTLNVNDDQLCVKSNDTALTKWYRLNLQDNVDYLLGAPEYYRESKSFIDSILNYRSAEPSFRTALKVEEIIEQVNHSR